ncbi:hypothetical protein Btru_067023 [Bulinus truncatus]|nr:hypothetical protein Btru_067023 [Bulinus truncatus]
MLIMRVKLRRVCFCLIIFLTLMLFNMTALLGVILRTTAELELGEMMHRSGYRLSDSPSNASGSHGGKDRHPGTFNDSPAKAPARSVTTGVLFPDILAGLRLDTSRTSANSNDGGNKSLTTKVTTRATSVPAPPAAAYHQYMVNLTDSSYYDPYLKTVMSSKSSCKDASSYDAIMGVHTAPGNADKRQAFRWMYLDINKTFPYKIKVFFFIGQVDNLTLQNQLTNESQQFGDLVQGSFLDSYRNLTYKAIFTFKWLSDHCQGMRLLLRLDDDVFLRVQRFFQVWTSMVRVKSNTILCDVKQDDPVTRKGKWSVKESEVVEDVYRFQHCLGYFSAMTPDIVHKLYETGRRTKFFWIDDVFLFGFVANKVGAKYVGSNRENARTRYKEFRSCFEKLGGKCKYMSTITKTEDFRSLHSLINNHTNGH